MKKHLIERIIAVAASALLAAGCAMPAFAEDNKTPILKIEQVTLLDEEVSSSKDIAIEVSISDNTNGFIATSFGISYDPALTLTDIKRENNASLAHCFYDNEDTGLIWFSGASGTPKKTANTASTETMFILYFSLPEDMTLGDCYPISFAWDAANGTTSYWYYENHTNVIGDIKAHSVNGGIALPDPNAPKFDKSSLELSVDDTTSITILNSKSEAVWVSDNPKVATVKDGIVTAISPGSCIIYAMFDGTSLSCPVYVTKDFTYDITNPEIIYIRSKDKKVSLRCPESMDANGIIWVSSNMEVVTVEDGALTVISDGASTVFAIYGNIVYQAIVIVELKEEPEVPTEEIPTETEPSTEEEITYGDVNLDGDVNILDCIILNRSLLGVSTLSDSQRKSADIYMDDQISAMDSLCILKYVLSLLSSVPVIP